MKKLLTIVVASLFLAACGGAAGVGTDAAKSGATKLVIKSGGKEITLEPKTSSVNLGNVMSTFPGKPTIQTSAHTLYFANYEMKDFNGQLIPKRPLTAPEEMHVLISLTGEDKTKDDSPFKVGTYSPKNETFNKVRDIAVVTFADGKQVITSFDTMGSAPKADGEVKITNVTAETVSGEVNLSDGDKSIKGTFTVKLPKAK